VSLQQSKEAKKFLLLAMAMVYEPHIFSHISSAFLAGEDQQQANLPNDLAGGQHLHITSWGGDRNS